MSMDITFLKEDQIWSDKALQVIKSYGTKTGMSDLAIVLGGAVGSSTKTSDDQRSGYLWSAYADGNGSVRSVHSNGDMHYISPFKRLGGARPALPSSVTSSITLSSEAYAEALAKGEARRTRKISRVNVVEYGEYPQTIASEEVGKELEQALSDGKLQATGKKYTFDMRNHDAFSKSFKPEEHAEYQHKGKRYIRVEAQPYGACSILSNGKKPQAGEPCWMEVQPIEWLKDPSGIWVARQALFAGVQFDRNQRYDGNFEKTDMKHYLQNYFAKEMQPSRGMDAPPVVGPATESINARREAQRRRALEDYTQGL